VSSRVFTLFGDFLRRDKGSSSGLVGPVAALLPRPVAGLSYDRDQGKKADRRAEPRRIEGGPPRKVLRIARRRVGSLITGPKYRSLVRGYRLPGGYERVYHYHVRKSAGTSLNRAFWELGGEPGPEVLKRMKDSPLNRTISNGLVIVRHNQPAIEQGLYFFANSHLPAHQLRLPDRTFTVTILRDPLSRLVSHYRYLRWLEQNDPQQATFRREGGWLGEAFRDFLYLLPRRHLEAQLYMFSAKFDVSEALENLARCSAVMFTESFPAGVRMLAGRLGLELHEKRERCYHLRCQLSDIEQHEARELLADEYRLFEAARARWSA